MVIWRGQLDQAAKQRAAITTVLAERLQKGSGLLTATDADGKQWLIPTTNIAAVNIRDRQEAPDAPDVQKRPIGFEPLIVERQGQGQAQGKVV